MPALVNTAANLILGAAMALVVRRSPGMREQWLAWPLLFLLGFEAIIATPIATYLFRFYPQWSLLYGFDPQIFPRLDGFVGWLSFVVIIANFVAVAGGYLATRMGLLSGQRWLIYASAAAGGALLVFLVLRYPERLVFIGDYDSFWHGEARFMLRRLAGWLGLVMYASGAAFVTWVYRRFRDHDPHIV